MKILFFSARSYDRSFFEEANASFRYHLEFLDACLDQHTVSLAAGFDAVCAFVNDTLDEEVLEGLASNGVRLVALRCAGFNHVDLEAADRLKIGVVRVPAYSPHAVAEHAVTLLLTLNRGIIRAHNRIREGNFALDGLLGFDLHGKAVGVVGTGKIGLNLIRILAGFGCEVLAYDPFPNPECEQAGARYVDLGTLLRESDVISLHCPLTPETHHLINEKTIATMKDGVMLLNTSRGGLIDTRSVIDGLKRGKIGYLGLDVYEEEGALFFEDRSSRVLQDDVFARLTTFPNVIVTGHQAFFTREALRDIAETTLLNVREFNESGDSINRVRSKKA